MTEQIGFNQSLQRIIADFALIELNLSGHLPVLSYSNKAADYSQNKKT